ncbi:MAG: hypothetical protein ABTS16_22850 [Candidatus Accumulibacter phosphatis]|jgi:hypothetical protein|uniref:Uncharacterized protein n=1 Tax=Candidatus Accumulibacter contiguus TaxID=2954381 RepID=A0ABX1TC74_9PROT|nr:hypothetical protein [Candidatus Accumulibacter contiguus]NMQ07282.1 hypothetical protein [Candidatus Accumulibacter contiguus]
MANAHFTLMSDAQFDIFWKALSSVTYAQLQASLARRARHLTDTELLYIRTAHKAIHADSIEEKEDLAEAWLESEAIHSTPHLTARSYALYQFADVVVESMVYTGV